MTFGIGSVIITPKGPTLIYQSRGLKSIDPPTETGSYHREGDKWFLNDAQPLGYSWDKEGHAYEVQDLHDVAGLGDNFIRNPSYNINEIRRANNG